MTRDLIETTARSMYSELFGGQSEASIYTQLEEVKGCVEATLAQKSLPVTATAGLFRERLTEFVRRVPAADVLSALQGLNTLIDARLCARSVRDHAAA